MRRPDSVTIQWILSGLQLRASRKQRLLHGCMDDDGQFVPGRAARANASPGPVPCRYFNPELGIA